EDATLRGPRVDVDRDVDRVAPAQRISGERVQLSCRQRLAVEERPRTGRVLEAQVLVSLQGGSRASEAIERRDQGLDVAGRVPVPHANLVLLAVGVLLAFAEALRFAQFEARVDAPAGRER